MTQTANPKEPIMTRTTTLLLLALACLMGMPPVAQAGYADGMNRYQYVAGNPPKYTDPSGLWKIDRKGDARATAIAEQGDTLSSLAKAVKLDGFEISRWAHGDICMVSEYEWRVWIHKITGPMTQSFLDNQVGQGEKLTVPNTAYIDVSTYTWGFLGYYLMGYKSGLSDRWSGEGLKVVYTNTWNTTKQSIMDHLAADDLYKFGYIGHGAAGTMTGLSDDHDYGNGEYWYGSKGILVGDKYTKYGIAELQIIACESYDDKKAWAKNVSPTGVMRLMKGDPHIWDIGDSLVSVWK